MKFKDYYLNKKSISVNTSPENISPQIIKDIMNNYIKNIISSFDESLKYQ